jgi:hypothetical protein
MADWDWTQDSIAAVSSVASPGSDSANEMDQTRAVLEAAGIPCHAEMRPGQDGDYAVYELLVPVAQHLLALSVLDKNYFNLQLEGEWQAHFSTLSDQDLLDLDADAMVAGLRDRAERMVRTYEDELLKRGLAELESE